MTIAPPRRNRGGAGGSYCHGGRQRRGFMFHGTIARQTLHWVAPEGTRRRKVVRLPKRFARAVKQYGLLETLRRIRAKVRRRLIRNDNDRLQQWYACSGPAHATLVAQRARKWPAARPTIDLVVPVARGDLARFLRTVRSLKAQTYPFWKIQVVAEIGCANALQRAAARLVGPERVRVFSMPHGIAPRERLNEALAGATGDFLGVIGAGDLLASN